MQWSLLLPRCTLLPCPRQTSTYWQAMLLRCLPVSLQYSSRFWGRAQGYQELWHNHDVAFDICSRLKRNEHLNQTQQNPKCATFSLRHWPSTYCWGGGLLFSSTTSPTVVASSTSLLYRLPRHSTLLTSWIMDRLNLCCSVQSIAGVIDKRHFLDIYKALYKSSNQTQQKACSNPHQLHQEWKMKCCYRPER